MSDVRTFATFDSDIVDESNFSDSGEMILPGGCNISSVIKDNLSEMGLVASYPIQYKFYGWEFEATIKGQKYWFLVQNPESWLLISEDRTGLFGRLKAESELFGNTLRELNLRLTDDERFSHIRWFTKAEYESGKSMGVAVP